MPGCTCSSKSPNCWPAGPSWPPAWIGWWKSFAAPPAGSWARLAIQCWPRQTPLPADRGAGRTAGGRRRKPAPRPGLAAGHGTGRRLLGRPPARWRADLGIEPDIDTAAALDAGFRSAFCFPLVSGDKTLGVCQFFGSQPRPADRDLLALAEGLGAQLGLFVEQETFAAALRRARTAVPLVRRRHRANLLVRERPGRDRRNPQSLGRVHRSNVGRVQRLRLDAGPARRRRARRRRTQSANPSPPASSWTSSAGSAAPTAFTTGSRSAACRCSTTRARSSSGSAPPPTSRTPGKASRPSATARPNCGRCSPALWTAC